MYDVGLTLGKFAPLHRGHQYLIETALREVGRLIVVVYGAGQTTDIPLAVRAGWIRRLYPAVEVLEAPEAPEDRGSSSEIRKIHEDFLGRFLAGRHIDAFYSSEDYGEYASRVFGCVNRLVDKERATVPVSATMIRGDPLGLRGMVDPLVLADLERHGRWKGAAIAAPPTCR
jgi:cytidyltransferase-like protein